MFKVRRTSLTSHTRLWQSTDILSGFVAVTTADVFEVRYLYIISFFSAGWLIFGVQKSYVGGLYLDQGLEAVRSWLRPLLLPDALESYRIVRKEYGLPPSDGNAPTKTATPLAQLSANTPMDASRSIRASPPHAQYSATSVGHLALFNQCLQQVSKSVEWVYSDSIGEGSKTTPIWVGVVYVCIFAGRVNASFCRWFKPS